MLIVVEGLLVVLLPVLLLVVVVGVGVVVVLNDVVEYVVVPTHVLHFVNKIINAKGVARNFSREGDACPGNHLSLPVTINFSR